MQHRRGSGRAWSLFVVCLGAGLVGCGAAEDEALDPADLALRDLLGVAPKVAAAWDADQRAAARDVLAGGLHAPDDGLVPAWTVTPVEPAQVVLALAALDGRLAAGERDALGLVTLAPSGGGGGDDARALDAPLATAELLDGRRAPPVLATVLELEPSSWPCPRPGACDLDVLAALAADAAPGAARVRVLPVVQLATVAALVPAGADGVPVLLVNPIVTAVGEVTGVEAAGGGERSSPVAAGPGGSALRAPLVTGTWSYGTQIAACAATVRDECTACEGGGACPAVWPGVSGLDACRQLRAQPQNFELLCIDLAVSLAEVGACVAGLDSTCTMDSDAINDPAMLGNNTNLLNDGACLAAIDTCLADLYGAGGDDTSCGSCDGCGCGSCDDSDCGGDNGSCNDNSNSSGCNDNNGGCNGGGCGDGGGCNNNSGGSCNVARAPARGAGLAGGVVWALLPIPAALFARRRARRRADDPARAPGEPPSDGGAGADDASSAAAIDEAAADGGDRS